MPNGSDYDIAVVLVNRHEVEGEVAGRLLEIADEKDYDPRVVEAVRGDHDTALSFRVPQDVADAFNKDRASRWPSEPTKAEKAEDGTVAEADLNADAYAADQERRAAEGRQANVDRENPDITPARTPRATKAKE
jgi:hypothetical protein